MEYQLIKSFDSNPILRDSFNELALASFDLSFEQWHRSGYWTSKYNTYSYCAGDQVVANASANLMSFKLENETTRAVQIGTVMTDLAFRGQGLATQLIELILEDWKSQADLIYLYANDESTSFYPKFGFERAYEYTYSCEVASLKPRTVGLRKLDLSKNEDLELLRQKYVQNNPFSAVKMVDNFELLMFYCGSIFANSIYYLAELELLVIAHAEGKELHCFDVYGKASCSFEEVLCCLVELQPGIEQIGLGFTPIEPALFTCAPILDYDNLFVLTDTKNSNLFNEGRCILPLLSHA